MGKVLPFTPPPLAPRDPRFVPRPVEMCSLASVWNGAPPSGQWEAEEKIDGVRCLFVDGETMSREAVPIDLPPVAAELSRLQRRFGEPMMFDGEYRAAGGFLDTLAVIGSRGRREVTGAFHLFDAVPLSDWRADACDEPLTARRHWIGRAWGDWCPAQVRRVAARPVATGAEIDRAAAAVWQRGGEGLMLKRSDSLYRRARSIEWRKVKREIALSGEIVGIVTGARAARVAVQGGVVRVALAPGQGDTLSVGMTVRIEAMEWTDRGTLRHGRIVGTVSA